jgi:adenosylcobinamide-phosphate synthase
MPSPSDSLPVLLLALIVEGAVGYPDRLYALVRHPGVWIGALIAVLDRWLNRPEWRPIVRRAAGVVALAVVLVATTAPAVALAVWLRTLPGGWVVEAALASTLLASRSLHAFVAAVPAALRGGGLVAGREAVRHIVGRNPESLDEAAVSRAAVESLAENFADGVVAPAVWLALLGLPGIVAYKAINTADSMIGHRTPRHEAFGWAAARLDDLVNLPGSRLAGLLIAAASATLRGARPRLALRSMWRDAPRHRSPNAGWPEAAMAGALGFRLGGPRIYGEVRVEDAWMGRGRSRLGPADVDSALALYRRTVAALWAVAAAATAAVAAIS